MKNMERPLIITALVLVVAGGFLIRSGLSAKKSDSQTVTQASTEANEASAETQRSMTSVGSETKGSAEGQASAGAKGTSAPVAQAPQKKAEFAYEKELGEYATIKSKVFLSDEEKANKARLMRDANFLKSLAELLRRPIEPTFEARKLHNAALDLLFESRSETGNQVAGEVLRSLVEDNQVENPSVDMSVREEMAGLKAEVLFQWSAQEPTIVSDVKRWLPGPVSERIWNNVIEAQRQNAQESAQEAASMTK